MYSERLVWTGKSSRARSKKVDPRRIHRCIRRVLHGMPRGVDGTGARAALERTEAELVRAVAGGDRAAFGELYDRLAPIALMLGYRILGSRREAEDVVHDVFLECWRNASLYDPTRGSVRSWLLVRMRSRSLDRLRARQAAPLLLDQGLLDRLVPRASDAAPGSERGLLHELLRQLSSEQRTVIELGYVDGYTMSEIASALGIPIGTVKSRTTRALDRLRLLLGRVEGAPG
jgi:RNA polymerase sigma-70 factor (ECF subfamily)